MKNNPPIWGTIWSGVGLKKATLRVDGLPPLIMHEVLSWLGRKVELGIVVGDPYGRAILIS